MDSEKKIIGRCPFCGGNVVKTCKGYRCENNTGEHPSCVLNINAIIGNRKMNDGEIAEFLEKRRILLDGFSTKEGKTFPTVLELADDGAVNMQSVIGRCPHCGGEVRVGTKAFNCSNYSNQEAPCSFQSYYSHLCLHRLFFHVNDNTHISEYTLENHFRF